MRRNSLICLLLALYASTAQAAPRWSYDGQSDGQEEWGALSKEFAACVMGKAQSPIQISETKVEKLPPLITHYTAAPAHIHYDGHVLIIDMDGKQTLSESGHVYTLKHILLHSPGEHTIKERFYLGEMQFVHEDAKGKILILSVFLTPGIRNSALDLLEKPLPANISLNPADLLPARRGYYAYTGSLTAPPCTEGVKWRLLKEPVQLAKSQLSALTRTVGRNARLAQPVYLRPVAETE